MNFPQSIMLCLRVHPYDWRVYRQCNALNRAVTTLTRSFYWGRCLTQIQKDDNTPTLSPQEVTKILRQNEFTKDFPSGNSVKSYDCNQLASNSPIEDTRSEAECTLTSGMIAGVFDGHGGSACAHVIAKRLMKYIAAALLPSELLKTYINDKPTPPLIESFNDTDDFFEEIKSLHEKSFIEYLRDLENTNKNTSDVASSLEQAILRLDEDISKEALDHLGNEGIGTRCLAVALSGAVACVAHIDGPNVHVANVGDCNAVIGTLTDDEYWIAKKITTEHNADNISELNRLWSEHPANERKTIVRRDRLLGELAPLRSLGDFRYKWPADVLVRAATPHFGVHAVPSNYHTPPYLTARPELYHEKLTHKDKFLILASDGVWDMITPLHAVRLVGEHMQTKETSIQAQKDKDFGEVDELFVHRKSKPRDYNAATHLIRHALGGTEYGLDHARTVQLLSLPPEVARTFRDDMTVTVIYFDSEYIGKCPI